MVGSAIIERHMSNKVRKQGGETQSIAHGEGVTLAARDRCAAVPQVRSQHCRHRHHLILWLCTFGDQAASKTQLHDMTEGNAVVERLIAIGRVALYLAAEI